MMPTELPPRNAGPLDEECYGCHGLFSEEPAYTFRGQLYHADCGWGAVWGRLQETRRFTPGEIAEATAISAATMAFVAPLKVVRHG
jgi:hypothetical protein